MRVKNLTGVAFNENIVIPFEDRGQRAVKRRTNN